MQTMPRNRQRVRDSVLLGDRETVPYLPSKSQRKESEMSMYNNMFNEDVKAGIIPYRNHYRQDTTTSSVQLSPLNDIVQEDISLVLSRGEHHGYSLEEAVSSFIRECANTIMCQGQVIYEIVNYTDEIVAENSFSRLEYVPDGIIKFFLRQPFQILYSLKGFENEESCFKKITKDKLVVFEMPKPYCNNYKALQSQLYMVEKYGVQNLLKKPLEEPNRKKKRSPHQNVNVTDGFKFSNLAVLSATNLMGWNARNLASKHLQEYFTLVRFLQFERFKLKLRNSILDTINDNLDRLISDPTYTGKLQFHGLPTDEDVERAEKDLREGSRKFNDIIAPFLKY